MQSQEMGLRCVKRWKTRGLQQNTPSLLRPTRTCQPPWRPRSSGQGCREDDEQLKGEGEWMGVYDFSSKKVTIKPVSIWGRVEENSQPYPGQLCQSSSIPTRCVARNSHKQRNSHDLAFLRGKAQRGLCDRQQTVKEYLTVCVNASPSTRTTGMGQPNPKVTRPWNAMACLLWRSTGSNQKQKKNLFATDFKVIPTGKA